MNRRLEWRDDDRTQDDRLFTALATAVRSSVGLLSSPSLERQRVAHGRNRLGLDDILPDCCSYTAPSFTVAQQHTKTPLRGDGGADFAGANGETS